MAEYLEFGNNAGAAGVLAGGEALHDTNTATTVHVPAGKGGEAVFTDGPFAETKEVLGGFYVLDVADLDEAPEVGATDPRRMVGHGRGAARHRVRRTRAAGRMTRIARRSAAAAG